MAQPQAQQTNGAHPKGAPPPARADDDAEDQVPDLVDMLNGEAEMPERETETGDGDEDAEGERADEATPAAAAEDDDEGDEEASTEQATDEGDDEVEDENRAASEEAFSERALKTAAGVKRARELVLAEHKAVQQRQKRLDRFDTRLRKREKTHRAQVDNDRLEIDQGRALARQVSTLITQMRTGTGAERLAALASLTGAPGLELLEELNMGVLTDGKKTTSPEVKRLSGELETLRRTLADKEEREAQQAEEGARDAKRQRIEQHAAEAGELGADAEKYPAIAAEIAKWGKSMREQVGDWVVRKITSHYKRTGQRLDKAKALSILNARLAKRAGAPPSEPRKGSTVRDSAKSPVAQRRSAGRGVTVTSEVADRSTGTERALSRDERIAELARDRSAMKSLGLGQFLEDED